jgi:hypothetical protein
MQISGVVILYHPDVEEVLRNVRTYIDYIQRLYVFANSNCSKETIESLKAIRPKKYLIKKKIIEEIQKH